MMADSGIARIENDCLNPIELFKLWMDEAALHGHLQPNALCLSTAFGCGKVSARTVLLRRLEDDGFVIVTDKRGAKSKALSENNQAAATFLWIYQRKKEKVLRQVRWEGQIINLPCDEFRQIYEEEPLYCKIRAHASPQGSIVTWGEQKTRHDQFYQEYKTGINSLPMPDTYTGYKFIPNLMDFYYAYDNYYADRLCYEKKEDEWTSFRKAA